MAVGWQETLLLLLLFFALISGQKMEELSKYAGKTLRQARKFWKELKQGVYSEKKDVRDKNMEG